MSSITVTLQMLHTAPLQVLRQEFGTDPVSFYAADTFNEMAPPSRDPAYLGSVARAVYNVRASLLI